MGVCGLLPELKDIQISTSIERYRGKTLAVDTYGWLHRALVSCSAEISQDLPTRKYINSVMKKVQMLRDFGVEPYMVFDGDHLPTKAATERERRAKREEAKAKAEEFKRRGLSSEAYKQYMRAADVSSQMAKSLIEELKLHNVKYVVAPYEADPQMVYLEKIGLVDGILSEDSDLLIFGCSKLITKLKDQGTCVEINRDHFKRCKATQIGTLDQSQLRCVAMLSGCDYTKGIFGVGMKGAISYVKKYGYMERIMMALKAEGKKIPETFEKEIELADLAFQYQRVFCPLNNDITTLNELPQEVPKSLDACCGIVHDSEIHRQIARGNLDPFTKKILISREQNLQRFSQLRSVQNQSSPVIQTATRSYSTPITKSSSSTIDSFFGASVRSSSQSSLKSSTIKSGKMSVSGNRRETPSSDGRVLAFEANQKRALSLNVSTSYSQSTAKSNYFKQPSSVVQYQNGVQRKECSTENFLEGKKTNLQVKPSDFHSPDKYLKDMGRNFDVLQQVKTIEEIRDSRIESELPILAKEIDLNSGDFDFTESDAGDTQSHSSTHPTSPQTQDTHIEFPCTKTVLDENFLQDLHKVDESGDLANVISSLKSKYEFSVPTFRKETVTADNKSKIGSLLIRKRSIISETNDSLKLHCKKRKPLSETDPNVISSHSDKIKVISSKISGKGNKTNVSSSLLEKFAYRK